MLGLKLRRVRWFGSYRTRPSCFKFHSLYVRYDIGIDLPLPVNDTFKNPASVTTAPDGIEFCLCQSPEEAEEKATIESLPPGGMVGVWVRQTILNGTPSRTEIEGALHTSWS